MNKISVLPMLLLALCGTTFAADGEVVRIVTGRFSKPAVESKLGDLIVFSVNGGTYPGGMIESLKVDVKGDCLTQVGVFLVPMVNDEGERAVGGIDMSAFLKTSKVGEAVVTITPQGDLNDKLAKPMKFLVSVSKPDKPLGAVGAAAPK